MVYRRVTPEAVFSDVEAVTAEIRNESTDKYHVAQKHIILGTLDSGCGLPENIPIIIIISLSLSIYLHSLPSTALIDEMYTWLNQKCDMHQLRFMVQELLADHVISLYNIGPHDHIHHHYWDSM